MHSLLEFIAEKVLYKDSESLEGERGAVGGRAVFLEE